MKIDEDFLGLLSWYKSSKNFIVFEINKYRCRILRRMNRLTTREKKNNVSHLAEG